MRNEYQFWKMKTISIVCEIWCIFFVINLKRHIWQKTETKRQISYLKFTIGIHKYQLLISFWTNFFIFLFYPKTIIFQFEYSYQYSHYYFNSIFQFDFHFFKFFNFFKFFIILFSFRKTKKKWRKTKCFTWSHLQLHHQILIGHIMNIFK